MGPEVEGSQQSTVGSGQFVTWRLMLRNKFLLKFETVLYHRKTLIGGIGL